MQVFNHSELGIENKKSEKGLRLSHDDVTKCYGNVYPITTLGKLLSGVIAILGIGIVVLPTGIISSGFMAEMKSRKEKRICPHCAPFVVVYAIIIKLQSVIRR